MNPYLKHAIGKAGRASETRLAKEMKGRAKPASGAMPGAKGDIDFPDTLLEAKSTTGASMALKHEWLLKIGAEARAQGKSPALAISFVNGSGRAVQDGDWVCVPRHVFDEWRNRD